MNKQELLEKIRTSRKEFDSTIARVSDDRKSMVILHGEWSVKDLIGHIGFWEERVVQLFNILKSGNAPLPAEDENVMNDRAVEESRRWSLGEIVESEAKAYKNVLAAIENALDAELFDPNHFPWTEGHSMEVLFSGNTWEHFEEHLPEVTAWLKRVA